MNYQPDVAGFDSRMTDWMPLKDTVTVVPGLWFAPRLETAEGIEVARQQIQSAAAKTGNYCVFSYAALFEVRDNRDRFGEEDEPQRRQAEARQRRAARREALLPVTKLMPPA